jgi:nitrogen fixation protein FixH
MTAPKRESALRSPWGRTIIGMLVVFVCANIYMLFTAGDSSNRMINKDYYKRGEDYEENMLKRLARDPGWKMKVSAPGFVDVEVVTPFTFTVTDKDGVPIDPDSVTFYAYRPSGAEHDFSLPMEKVATGEYRADVSFPLKGVWDILVAVTNGEDEYQEPYRISAGVDSR